MASNANPFNHIQHPKQRAFLSAFSHLGLVTRAARAAKIERTSHFLWKRDDPIYARAFELAQQIAAESLEDAAVIRARDGIERPVFHKGKVCGYTREYSDSLLIFTLKGLKPDKYRERWDGRLTGANGGPIETRDVSARELLEARISGIEAASAPQADPGRHDGEPTP